MNRPEGNVDWEALAAFEVRVWRAPLNEHGYHVCMVKLRGIQTGLMETEYSPVPEWALIRAWRKLAKKYRELKREDALPPPPFPPDESDKTA